MGSTRTPVTVSVRLAGLPQQLPHVSRESASVERFAVVCAGGCATAAIRPCRPCPTVRAGGACAVQGCAVLDAAGVLRLSVPVTANDAYCLLAA